MEKKDSDKIIHLGVLIIFIVVFGLIAWLFALRYQRLLPDHTGAVILIITMFALASVTFFSLMSFSQTSKGVWAQNKDGMRMAIMAPVLLVYFFLLGINVFLNAPDTMPEITSKLIENFVYTFGIVVAFYFGSSAYVQTHSKDNNNEEAVQKDTKTKTE